MKQTTAIAPAHKDRAGDRKNRGQDFPDIRYISLPTPMRLDIPSIAVERVTSIVRSDKNPPPFRDKSPSPKSNACTTDDRLRAALHSGIIQMAIAILARNDFYCKEKYSDC
jgi:hypothetical protein